MWAIKRVPAIALCVLFCLTVMAQDLPRNASGRTGASQDVTIIIEQQQVRFIAQKAGEEMRLQVFDQTGELVFDSGAVQAAEVNWPLQAASGEMLKSGLYAYTLSLRETGAAEARPRRGHLIVDRAKDRDGADKLWVTSQNENAVGAELTVARDEAATVAGAAISNGQNGGDNGGDQRTMGRHGAVTALEPTGRKVDAETTSQTKSGKAVTDGGAGATGTIGQIAKFTSTTDVGNSVISEVGGNVGIGTAPSSGIKLEVNGTTLISPAGTTGVIQFGNPASETGISILGSNRADVRFDGSTLKLVAGPLGGPPPAERGMVINTLGNIGMGTVNPESKLDVFGTTLLRPGGSGGIIQFGNPASETGMSIVGASNRADVRFDGSTLKLVAGPVGGPPPAERGMVINTLGNVGVGTNSPASKLHVESSGPAEMTIRSTDERAILTLDNGLSRPIHYVWTLESGVGGTFTSLFGIYNRNVGKAGLTIDGNLLVSVKAVQITGGADFAENFDVRAEKLRGSSTGAAGIQPGMVVAIDPINPGRLSLSRRAYDRRVAGIISGAGGVKPGMTMGQEQTLAEGKYPVALSGRVYVWVDAARGAIHPGDLLTTSATPGYAMRAGSSVKAHGAIIGKAMTGLKGGRGLVLVLVTLQ
jgi:hypothetical protein